MMMVMMPVMEVQRTHRNFRVALGPKEVNFGGKAARIWDLWIQLFQVELQMTLKKLPRLFIDCGYGLS